MLKEIDIENSAINWLKDLGYSYKHGSELKRDVKTVVLQTELEAFIAKTYPHIPPLAQKEVVAEFVSNQGADLEHRNHNFQLKLAKGIDVSWKDANGNEKAEHVYAVDYTNIENNSFLAVNQMVIVGKNRRIPDLIIFVNGLPLVVFEFKKLVRRKRRHKRSLHTNTTL